MRARLLPACVERPTVYAIGRSFFDQPFEASTDSATEIRVVSDVSALVSVDTLVENRVVIDVSVDVSVDTLVENRVVIDVLTDSAVDTRVSIDAADEVPAVASAGMGGAPLPQSSLVQVFDVSDVNLP